MNGSDVTGFPTAGRREQAGAVRVFISSTFLDMQRERDLLVNEVFPPLRAKWRGRGIELLEIDLRWGITDDQVARNETLPILLAEIDRCRPFFIGLLGERYGWVPPDDSLADGLHAAFPGIGAAAGRSVTELEIEFGVLTQPQAVQTALFLERDPAWLRSLPANVQEQYREPNRDKRAKLEDLKARIRSSGATIISYGSPEVFAAAAAQMLDSKLEEAFPGLGVPDPDGQHHRLHEAYARDHRGIHIGGEHDLAAIDAWMDERDPPPILAAGASGCGKSTLLATWALRRRTARPEDIVIEHYLGASVESGDPVRLVRRLWDLLDRSAGAAGAEQSGHDNLELLADAFWKRVEDAAAAAGKRGASIVFVVDALDKLTGRQDLDWISRSLPSNVRLLTSALDSQARNSALHYGWRELQLAGLSTEERNALLQETLRSWGRDLPEAMRARIAAHHAGGSPLFLKTVLAELRYSAVHEGLRERLDYYLASRDIPDLFQRLLQRLEESLADREMVAQALALVLAGRAGLEESSVLAILQPEALQWSKLRYGLGEALIELDGRLTFGHDHVSQAVGKRYTDELRRARVRIAEHFLEGPQDARQFEEAPYQLREAGQFDSLLDYCLDTELYQLSAARKDGRLFEYWRDLRLKDHDPSELLCQALDEVLPGPFLMPWDFQRAFAVLDFLDDSGWLNDEAGGIVSRLSALTEVAEAGARPGPMMLHVMMLEAKIDMQCRRLDAAEERLRRLTGLMEQRLGTSSPVTRGAFRVLANVLHQKGDFQGAESVIRASGEMALRGSASPREPEVVETLIARAAALNSQGRYQEARESLEIVHQHLVQAGERDTPRILACLYHLGLAYMELGELEHACDALEWVWRARTRTEGRAHSLTLDAANALAACCVQMRHFDSARNLLEGALLDAEEHLGERDTTTVAIRANLADLLERMDGPGEAVELARKAAEDAASVFGKDHPDTLTTLNNLAAALRRAGRFQESIDLTNHVLEARTEELGARHPLTIASRSNLATALFFSGDAEAALTALQYAVELSTEVLGEAHLETIGRMDSLVEVLRKLGRTGDANRLDERAILLRVGQGSEANAFVRGRIERLINTLASADANEAARVTAVFSKLLPSA